MHLFDGPNPHEFDAATEPELPDIALAEVLTLGSAPQMSLRALKLVGVPNALPREAPSSWLARAALSQFVTVADLLGYFGWRPAVDFDVWFADWFADGVAAPGKEFRELEVSRRVLGNLSANAWNPGHLLLRHQRKPRYRFCPLCFSADETPYVRQEWRFDTWRVCWEHGCMMEDSCAQCGALLTLPINMVSAANMKGIGLLAECRVCGTGLSRRRAPLMLSAVQHLLSSHQMTRLENGPALMATLWCGHGRVDGICMPTHLENVRRFAVRALLAVGDTVPSTTKLRRLCGHLSDTDLNARVNPLRRRAPERSGLATPVGLDGQRNLAHSNCEQGENHALWIEA